MRFPEGPVALLIESADPFDSKVTMGVLRFSQYDISALVFPGGTAANAEEIFGIRPDVPVVGSLSELSADTRVLLIGVASKGGKLPDHLRPVVRQALKLKLSVVAGLHTMLAEDAEFAELAAKNGCQLIDLRAVNDDPVVASGEAHRPGSVVIHTVGSDCNTGKMTTTLRLTEAARKRELISAFVATGQTGIAISGFGVCADRVICDFLNGEVEEEVLFACNSADYVFVEGQGSLAHPGYSAVTLGLLHGCAPDILVLCHDPSRENIRRYEVPIQPLPRLIEMYENAASWRHPARLGAIALNTAAMSPAQASEVIARTQQETGLFADDVVRFGADSMFEAITTLAA